MRCVGSSVSVSEYPVAGILIAQAPLRLTVPVSRSTRPCPHPMTPANALLVIACASSWMRRKWSLPRKLSA
jgi:hypothetical protein